MLTKNETKLLSKLSPIFMAILNEENMACTFTYFDGVQANVIGSDRATLKMEKETRENPSWLRVFKADEKELMREKSRENFDRNIENGDIIFVSQSHHQPGMLPLELDLLKLTEMQPWMSKVIKQERDRKYGQGHGVEFVWGKGEKPDFWDESYSKWEDLKNSQLLQH